MATLVTGGTGFVGVNIVKGLAQAGHQVVCLDLNVSDQLTQTYLSSMADKIKFVQADILDQAAVEQLGSDHAIDKIVHAAVYTVNRVELETRRSRAVIDTNITGTANILELARTLKVERFLYISSGAVYGPARATDQTFNEDDAAVPDNLYGITKYTSELLTRRYGQLHQISTASARLSTPYGPMERVTGHRAVMSIFYHWTGCVVREEPVAGFEDGPGRDYTYVADIADGIRTILDAPTLPHDLYNITAGGWVDPAEIKDELKKLSPESQFPYASGVVTPLRGQEGGRGPLSGQRLMQDLEWRPKYDLASGLSEYLRWRREVPSLD